MIPWAHAPEVECIGKGKAHTPDEFGVKVSVATTLNHAKGGQFVTHVQTLERAIPAIEAQVGATLTRLITDAATKGTRPRKPIASRSTPPAGSTA